MRAAPDLRLRDVRPGRDARYRPEVSDFELTLEARLDWGCDSGIFFRATESGAAYQITMDCLGTGNRNLGRMIGEGGISLAALRPLGAHPQPSYRVAVMV
jgi:hypothetical protein